MSFKQKLKMRLPFTRKGLEDYLDEKLTLMQRQQAENIQSNVKALSAQLAQEINAQLHRRINDLEGVIELQSEALKAYF